LTWFENNTRVLDLPALRSLYRRGDIFVLSEDVGQSIQKVPTPKVIFNQNLYHGFTSLGEAPLEQYPYHDAGLLGVMAVSAHNIDSLTYAFPDTRILRVVYGIDLDRYRPVPLAEKSPVIATIMKGGSTPELLALFHMLNARAQQDGNPLKEFEWVFIKNNTEAEVAGLLQRAVLFIFLSGIEGSPLLPLEAMAAGCLVVTYDMGPLREFVPSDCRFPPGDLVSIARYIELVAASRSSGHSRFEELVSRSQAIASGYTLERERDSVLSVWRLLLS
jgi:glycosyltransferase involved in cell wall biosynthesis